MVGSLLRPPEIHAAREKLAAGEIDSDELRAIEDGFVQDAVALQRDAGLKVATDGDFHRAHWFMDFFTKIDGIEVRGGLPQRFQNEGGEIEFAPPKLVTTAKLKRSQPLASHDYAGLNAILVETGNGLTGKQCIPSPTIAHFRGGRAGVDETVYPDIEDFYEDLAQVYRDEIQALYDAGCRYLQIDETNLPFLCDPKIRAQAESIGEDPDQLLPRYAQLINQCVRDAPDDMAVCIHMCRGNHESSWVADGGYDPVAEVAFGDINVDGFFLEYDSPRAGGFAPLRYLTGDKVAVLGLMTTKRPDLEPKEDVIRRINEAADIVPLDRLALSPQCGFASTIGGNTLTVDDEKAKLAQVVEIAAEVWG